jgi:hypothetical protein
MMKRKKKKMPMIEGKKFPYTAKGIAAAKKASKKHEKTEGKMEREVEYGKKKPGVKKPAIKKKK